MRVDFKSMEEEMDQLAGTGTNATRVFDPRPFNADPDPGYRISIHIMRIRIQGFKNECGSRYGSRSKHNF